uniref:Glycoside hydrolase family 5 domain-containing protein n=1 Tax=Neobodo designis TaxID=312471 RepID=A0A7S1QA68_NEODS
MSASCRVVVVALVAVLVATAVRATIVGVQEPLMGSADLPSDIPRVSVVPVGALWTLLGNSPQPPSHADTSLRQACADNGFTFVRIGGSAFWPVQLAKYNTDHVAYMQAVEQLYNISANHGCRVLLSLFWNWHAVPDLHNEHLGAAMRNASSLSWAFWRQYTRDVMTVAAKYPQAVAGWELGNELNNLADLNMTGSKGGCAPHLGTPTHRTSADNFSTTDMIDFEVSMANMVRATAAEYNVPHALISDGHSIPRMDAHHLRESYHDPRRDWRADTEAEFASNLVATCSCCELCSAHFYAHSGQRWGHPVGSTYPLEVAHRALAGMANKTLYVGEFGDNVVMTTEDRPFSMRVLDTLNRTGIRLATLWVWEFYQKSVTVPANFSISPDCPEDLPLIDAMKALNQQE